MATLIDPWWCVKEPSKTEVGSQHAKRMVWRWALFGLVFNLVLTTCKWFAYALTSSTAIMSDAIESLVNVLSSLFVLYAVWLSHRPRDVDHPYGHGKVEYFSAGFEGALVLGAAVSIAIVAVWRLMHPIQPHRLGIGLILEMMIAISTLIVGQILIRAGKKWQSMSLEADGVHIRSDAITSFAAFFGVLGVWLTQWWWLDAAVALLVAVWLVWSGIMVMREAIGGLMDEADPLLLDRIAEVLERIRQPGWLAPHHLKVHRLGPGIHIDMHMVFPAFWTIEQVHECTVIIDQHLRAEFGAKTEVMIHMESCRPDSCAYCLLDNCPIRQQPFSRALTWDGALLREPRRASFDVDP